MSRFDGIVIELSSSEVRYGFDTSSSWYGSVQLSELNSLYIATQVDNQQMIELWQKIVLQHMRFSICDKNVTILYPFQMSKTFMNSSIDILFELLRAKEIRFVPQYVLPLLSTGRSCGVVIDFGYDSIQFYPVAYGVVDLFHSTCNPNGLRSIETCMKDSVPNCRIPAVLAAVFRSNSVQVSDYIVEGKVVATSEQRLQLCDVYLHPNNPEPSITYALLSLLSSLSIDIVIPCISNIMICGDGASIQGIEDSLLESVELYKNNPQFSSLCEAMKHIRIVNGGKDAVWKGYVVSQLSRIKESRLSREGWMFGEKWIDVLS